ncbi:MAG TPA: efflux RND transporter periplasmic adaptor subunit [candidate division Zixibacteria bacterium]|nr:efflux RND transporter periplasmic adaptor subunit [candidate division Zixibacteria bacterium]
MNAKKPLAIAFFLALTACSRERPVGRGGGEANALRGVEVEVVQPTLGEDFFEATGTVVSRRTATLSSKIVGTVVAVAVREGDRVPRGKTVVEIDNRDLRAELQGAEAALDEIERAVKGAELGLVAARGQRELAYATFKRYESLIARGSVAPQEYDEVRTRYAIADAEAGRAEENLQSLRARKEQAKARLAYARAVLSYTAIAAPFDALVTAKTAEAGMLASPGSPLLTLEEAGHYRLELQVGESRMGHVALGKTVPVVLDAVEQELSGNVAEIVPAADPRSRTFTVKVALPSHPAIRSGLYGKARFSLGKRTVLSVPAAALLRRGQLVGIYVANPEGIVRFRLVTTGERYGDRVEILSGLKAGERVVTKGIERVDEGSKLPRQARSEEAKIGISR